MNVDFVTEKITLTFGVPCRVTGIIDAVGDIGLRIILSQEVYKELYGHVGILTLISFKNKEKRVVKEVIHSGTFICAGDGSFPYSFIDLKEKETGIRHVAMGYQIMNALNLEPGAYVFLEKTLCYADHIISKSLKDQINPFGKVPWKHSYYANAVFNGICDDKQGHSAIFLTSSQIKYLNLIKRLRPLCGERRYQEAVARNQDVVGVVQLFHKEIIVEVDAFGIGNVERGSTICINKSLSLLIGPLKNGDQLFLCSRFDVENVLDAKRKSDHPQLPPLEPYDAIQLLREIEDPYSYLVDERLPTSDYDFVPQIKLAQFLISLAEQADQIAGWPMLLRGIFKFLQLLPFYDMITETEEFKNLLLALEAYKRKFICLQTEYMELLSQEINNCPHANPLMLEAFFLMELPLRDKAGRNLLHLMFMQQKGNISDLDDKYGPLIQSAFFWQMINEVDSDNNTPLLLLELRDRNWQHIVNLCQV